MSQSLLIAVRFQEGRYHGQDDGFTGAGGWPPSPGRLFQALVAAAAAGATISGEDERALKWLEELEPPRIAAPPVRRGRAVKLYVPNNDLDAVGGDPARVAEIRVAKPWRPCFFDPDQPVLYVWDFESGPAEAAHICAIAERLYQLGRTIDSAWASGQILERDEAEIALDRHPGPVRRPEGIGTTEAPCPGTLDSLVLRQRCRRERLATVSERSRSRQLFTQPPKPSFRHTDYDVPVRRLHFEMRNLEGGFAPYPLGAAASLITGLRDAVAMRLQRALPENSALFERLVIGRGAGSADIAQRIRLIPVPSVGMEHTDPSIRRIMVEVPPDCPMRLDDLGWAFSGLSHYDPETGELSPWQLVSTDDDRMAARFQEPAHEFKSVTPVALSRTGRRRSRATTDRTTDERSLEEQRACGMVIQALRHAGVRVPPVGVRVQREPFDRRGERAGAFAGGTRFPAATLWHTAVTFGEPIPGPLLIGDGRYLGLGLMRPDESNRPMLGVMGFAIETGLSDDADSGLVARAARRAMMARVQQELPRGRTIPAYVSGHHGDGRPVRDGAHRHIAVVADLPRQRILFIAPNLLQRNGVRWSRVKTDHLLAERALRDMNVLRSGEAGRLILAPTTVGANADPLFAPARVWESVTDYQVTRHSRGLTDKEALEADVLAELRRSGWPVPKVVEALSVRRGPRGGLSGRLRLSFAAAEEGPLLLGRTAHKGGGLFAGSA